MKIEQTFRADIQGVGEITATKVNLPAAVELHAGGDEVYPDMEWAQHRTAAFMVPLSLENVRKLGGEIHKTAKVTITIETEEEEKG